MLLALLFIFGLIVGSFLNATIHRLWTGQSIAFDRSACPHCGHVLRATDLIPLLSFVFLKGRCRYCGKKISWQYSIVELFTALSFSLLGLRYGLQITNYGLWFGLIFISFLILIAVFDLKHYLILDKVLFPAIALAFVWSIIADHLINSLFGVLIISGFFAVQYFYSRGRWIGFGDVKLGVFLGLIFGVSMGLMLLFLSYCLGALVGLVLIGLGYKTLGSRMPFGTILGFSAIIMLLVGTQILDLYLRLVGLS